MSFKFEKLKVWQRAIQFSGKVHEVTRDFPKEELFILNSEFKRAADSIALNIAEGSTGSTNKQFHNFLGHALRSSIECVSCIYIARERKIISDAHFQECHDELSIIVKMIQGLRNSIT